MAELTPCNQNPWYVMMTLCGEQQEAGGDWELARENRRLWNAWFCRGLLEEEVQTVSETLVLPISELRMNAESQIALENRYRSEWVTRNPDIPAPPIPKSSDHVDFSELSFERPLLVTRLYIPGLDAKAAEFAEDVTFSNCLFARPVALSKMMARCDFDMSASIFDDDVHCTSTEFVGDSMWIGAQFDGHASFNLSRFRGIAGFGEVRFLGGATMSAVDFQRNADFGGLATKGEVAFTSSTFAGRVKDAEKEPGDDDPYHEVDFRGADFGGRVEFAGCKFNGITKFDKVRFGEAAAFYGAEFRYAAMFSFAQFTGLADFYGATFDTKSPRPAEELSFANARFEGPVSFEDARFLSRFPVMSGAALNGTTTVTALDDFWPRTGARAWGQRKGQGPVPHGVTKAAAARLRHVMGKQGLPEEEHFFFRREMHAAARAEPFWRTAHIYLYEALSHFGYSITRPLGWIALVWAIGAWVYATRAFLDWGTGAAYSFATMFKFFGFQRTFLAEETARLDAIPWMEVFAAGQTVLGFVLLFFLGLGLRTRFRLR